MTTHPPQYILLSHSNLSSTTLNPSTTLSHPVTIQYHFRDDQPLPIPDNHKHVLVMDYDPASPENVRVQSLSPALAVAGVRVAEAPGADDEHPNNSKMYVIETLAHQKGDRDTPIEDIPPVVSLTSFKQRNALLRKALEFPLPSAPSSQAPPTGSPRPSPSTLPVT
ncbi:hypothetical protein BU17DRAFT_92374 [Hysterangium stoloniferum]|nr:hypothetical protein BU17DRAFT_92374 [Hysterangium stoloniferum]